MMHFLVAIVCTTALITQDTAMDKHKMQDMDHTKVKKDSVLMEDGKKMVMKAGKTMAMDQDMILTNGATVMTDDSIKMKDGTS